MKNVKTLKAILSFLKNLPDNQLQIKDLNTENLSLPFMYSVSVNYQKISICGYGQAENKDRAIFIALMEVAERILLIDHSKIVYSKRKFLHTIKKNHLELIKTFPQSKNWIGNSSNGLAIHSNRNMAQQNALDELIERHVVLKSLISHIPPAKVTAPDVLDKYVIPSPIVYNFYAWAGPIGRYVVLLKCQQEGRSIYGLGCGTTLEIAKEKAFFEASPRISILHRSLDPSLVVMIPNKNFLYHWYEKAGQIEAFFKRTTDKIPHIDQSLSYNDFWFGEFTESKLLKHLNLYAIKSVCPKVQTLFSGHWNPKHINPEAVGVNHQFPKDMHMIG